VWVSTSPWQLGEYVCYDLKKVFGLRGMKQDQEINEQNLTVPADTFLSTSQYKDFVNFRRMRQRMLDGESINTDSLVATNPQYYFAYVIAGDYTFKLKNYKKALGYYQTALTKVIATKKEEEHIKIQIARCGKKLKNS
jgi:hypothetical protein